MNNSKKIIGTELLSGQGLGNQLFCYITIRCIAKELGYDFCILGSHTLANNIHSSCGLYFMDLDFGEELKNDDLVKAAGEAITYEPDNSQFQGEVGQRIEVELTVEKAIHLDGYYGPSTMHIFRDANGNAYVWTTASKSWEEGSTRLVRGTIKEHKTYKNVNQTVLTRCAEVKSK